MKPGILPSGKALGYDPGNINNNNDNNKLKSSMPQLSGEG